MFGRNPDWNSYSRSTLSLLFLKIGVLKIFANFSRKNPCWSLFLKKLQVFRHATLLKRDSHTSICLCNFEICQTFENTFLDRTSSAASFAFPLKFQHNVFIKSMILVAQNCFMILWNDFCGQILLMGNVSWIRNDKKAYHDSVVCFHLYLNSPLLNPSAVSVSIFSPWLSLPGLQGWVAATEGEIHPGVSTILLAQSIA